MKKLILLTVLLCGCTGSKGDPAKYIVTHETWRGHVEFKASNIVRGTGYASFNDVETGQEVMVYGNFRIVSIKE